MSAAEIRRIVASGDEQAARRAVRGCAEPLHAGTDVERAALLETLVPLARHPSAVVRLGVADVCDAFPDAAFDETHALLFADDDRFVRAAAEAAGHRRAQRRRLRAKSEADEQALDETLAEIERRHGKGARRLAERAAERSVEQFAQLLDHETRKTKNAIHLALTQLATELARPERSVGLLEEQVATLRERCAFVFSIVRRARDYATRVTPAFAEEGLAEIVHEARTQLLQRMGARASKVVVTLDIDAALRVEVDRFALLQALQNVLQNAVEAYDDRAARLDVRVVARTRRGGSEVELSVADDGVGIPAEHLEALFIPFGSKKPGGTGVGLPIVRRVVEDVHGGTLDLTSAPGKGTTVTMVLPARQRP